MIFTFNGQNTYIFDLDRTGKALVLNQGIVDLGEASSPQCLAILRLEDNAVVMDIQATADNGEFHLVTEDDRQSFILDDGDTVEISGNHLHIYLHRNDDGDLLGGEFILESMDENNGQAGTESSGEKSNSDTSDTGVKHKSGGLFETLIYSSQPDTPSKTGSSDTPVPPKQDNDEELSETLVVDENSNENHGATENLSETRVSVEDLSETRMSVEDLSETRITLEELSETKHNDESGKASGGNEPQDGSGNADERLSGETSLIESTFFSVDVVNKLAQKKKSEKDGKEHLLKIGDGIKEDSSSGEFDYHVMKYVGQGGFGQVYKIEDKYKNPFALKVLLPKVLEKSNFALSLFDQEVGIARFLEYSGLVKALEHYYDSKRNLHYCIMTYIDGVSFTDVIDYYADRHTSMHYMFATLVVLKVAEALDYLSEHGVVHRDIKPQNVMLTRDGEVKVLDLGISRRDFNTQPLADNEVLGTLPYVPLGQFLHQDPVDVRVDIYSLGVMYYGLLTCDHPYLIPSRKLPRAQRIELLAKELYKSFEKPSLTPNPRAKNKNVPESVAKVVMKMMAQDVKRRYKNADDLIHDLERITGSLTAKEVKRELSNLCDAVKNKKPVPVPTAGIRNRATTLRKANWLRPLAWCAAIIVILGLAVMFVKNVQERTDSSFVNNEKQWSTLEKEKKANASKLDLSALALQLRGLEESGGVLNNPEHLDQPLQMKEPLDEFRETIHFIDDFEIQAKSLLIQANSVSDSFKDAQWVKGTMTLWPAENQQQFRNIKEDFKKLEEKLVQRAEDAKGKMAATTEELAGTVKKLATAPNSKRADILNQLSGYASDMEVILLCRDQLVQKNVIDDAGLQKVEDQIKGHKDWQAWCTDLWKIQDDLQTIDVQKADSVLSNAKEKIDELEKRQKAFGGFKDGFKATLDQVSGHVKDKKLEMDIMRDIDSKHEKIKAVIWEIGNDLPSEKQMEDVRSIYESAKQTIAANAGLADKLVSCREKLGQMESNGRALETLANISKNLEKITGKILNLKNMGDNIDVDEAQKELGEMMKAREADNEKLAAIGSNMFSAQVKELRGKWDGIIRETELVVKNAQAKVQQQGRAILQKESKELAELARNVSAYVDGMVTWNWDVKRKETDMKWLRKAIGSAAVLLDGMKMRQTDNEEEKQALVTVGKKNYDIILGMEQEVKNALMPTLEIFDKIKTELAGVGMAIGDIETQGNNGTLQTGRQGKIFQEKIDALRRSNNGQFEPIAKLKDWSERNKPNYLPMSVMKNFEALCAQLLKMQNVNETRLVNLEKIMKDVLAFLVKMKAMTENVEELEALCSDIVKTTDVSKKDEAEKLYDQIVIIGTNLKTEASQTKNRMNIEREQAIAKELDKAKNAWDSCQKIFKQLEAFEKGMDELKQLLAELNNEVEKLKTNASDFEKVEVVYKAFQGKLENVIIVPGVIPGKKIEERNQLAAKGGEAYRSYEKIKREKKKEYEAARKEFDNLLGRMREMDEKLERGKKVEFKDLGKTYFDTREKYTQLCSMPGDKEIKKDQKLLTEELLPETERLYRKSLKSLSFLNYIETYSSLQGDLGKKKWGLTVSEADIQEKVKTCRGLAEELLRDENLSLEKRKLLEGNLREMQGLEKRVQP